MSCAHTLSILTANHQKDGGGKSTQVYSKIILSGVLLSAKKVDYWREGVPAHVSELTTAGTNQTKPLLVSDSH